MNNTSNESVVSKRPKILFVGSNDLLVPFINDLVTDHEVTVVESGDFGKVINERVEIVKLSKAFFGLEKIIKEVPLPFYFKGLSFLLKKEAPDYIVVMDWVRVWYWQVVLHKLRHPAVTVVVYSETQRSPRNLIKRVLFVLFRITYQVTAKYMSAYFAYTDYGKDYAKQNILSHTPVLVPVGIDTEFFTPSKKNLVNKEMRLLMNARYVDYKRHEDVIRAVQQLKVMNKKVVLTFIGRDEKERQSVESLVRVYNLQDRVNFQDPVPYKELPFLYSQFDVLILPSDNEAIGLVVPEAMACGLPTITSDTVGANVYVKNMETGLIFPTGNVSKLTSCIELLMDTELRSKMGISARQHIEKFSSFKMVSNFRSALLQAIRQTSEH